MGPNKSNNNSGSSNNSMTVPCGSIVVEQLGRLYRRHALPPFAAAAALDGKVLYLGDGCQYHSRARDWTALRVVSSNNSNHHKERGGAIVLEDCNPKKQQKSSHRYTLTPVADATVKEQQQWTLFGAKLTKMMARYGGAANVDSKFPNSNLDVHSPSSRQLQQRRNRGGRYGSAPSNRIYNSNGRSSQSTASWNTTRHTTALGGSSRRSVGGVGVHPVVSLPRKSGQKLLLAQQRRQPPEEHFSEDDDDDENLPEAEAYYDDNDAPEPNMLDDEDDDDDGKEEAEAAANDDDDDDRKPKANKNKSSLLLRKKRRRRLLANDDSSDDDDFAFDDDDDDIIQNDMTTPAATRFVSPRETSRIKRAAPSVVVPATAKSFSAVLDNDDDGASSDDDDNNEKEDEQPLSIQESPSNKNSKSQTIVSKFFAPLPSQKQPPPIAAARTPPRHHSVQSARMSQAIRSHKKKKRKKAPSLSARTPASSWLDLSPTKKKDPEENRRQELFGPFEPRAIRSSSSPLIRPPDDDDDMEERPRTPTRQRTSVKPSLEKHSSLSRGKRNFDRGGRWHQRRRGSSFEYPRSKFARLSYPGTSAAKRFGDDSNDVIAHAAATNQYQQQQQQQQQRFRGLRNLKNTCYQNASLQMLCTCRSFMARLQQQQHGRDLTNAVCRVAAELDVAGGGGELAQPPASAKAVKEAMDRKTDKFWGFDQHDAHEFLSDLVDYVHEELEGEEKEKNNSKDNDDDNNDGDGGASTKPKRTSSTYPTDDFCLTVQVCLQCQSCGYSRTKEEMYRHLSIDIVKEKPNDGKPAAAAAASPTSTCEASVESSLARFFEPEMREIKCEKCHDGTHAEQTLHILSRPKILLLHLKRFIVEEKRIYAAEQEENENRPPNSPARPISVDYICKKDSAKVKMPLSLTLDPFQVPLNAQAGTADDRSSSNAEDARASALTGKDYALKSVVYHTGTRASSGHYFADALRRDVVDEVSASPTAGGQDSGEASGAAAPPTEKTATTPQDAWYCFDDTNSFRHPSSEAITKNAYRQENSYMLLYSLDDDNNSVEECAAGPAVAEAGSFPVDKAVEKSKVPSTTSAAISAIAKGAPVEAQTADGDCKVEASASSAAPLSQPVEAVAGSKLEDATVVDTRGDVGALDTVEEAKPEGLAPAERQADAATAPCKSNDADSSLSVAECGPSGAKHSITENASETVTASEPLLVTRAAEENELHCTSSQAAVELELMAAESSTVKESKLDDMASQALAASEPLGATCAAGGNKPNGVTSEAASELGAKSTAKESKLDDMASEAVGAGESSGAPSAADADMLDNSVASESAAVNESFGANDSVEDSKLDDTACTCEESTSKAACSSMEEDL